MADPHKQLQILSDEYQKLETDLGSKSKYMISKKRIIQLQTQVQQQQQQQQVGAATA
ncbi:predicted protein [Histoplasma mississippiense (nom. inval.)]|uniref:predicted protein n=1 Tax=Ajellomyces capsulatus (strain NAm1 / WU24) TaxID=2059318 RepID=UPI000157C45C|nr:predicted protein [Histoplasma mississippiense (nom. inval.)]EDN08911.1 predicted protein [Histoplasma mississippiense (nom. inval.)]